MQNSEVFDLLNRSRDNMAEFYYVDLRLVADGDYREASLKGLSVLKKYGLIDSRSGLGFKVTDLGYRYLQRFEDN